MNIPKYNKNLGVSKYISQVNEYKYNLKANDYNNILNIFNDIFNSKMKSITDYNHIPKELLKKNFVKYCKSLNKHKEFINKTLDMQLELFKDDDIRVGENYVIYLLTKLVKYIGYKLKRIKIDDDIYYKVCIR